MEHFLEYLVGKIGHSDMIHEPDLQHYLWMAIQTPPSVKVRRLRAQSKANICLLFIIQDNAPSFNSSSL